MECDLKFIDLFCGIGSFHHSFTSLGMKCVFACDVSEDCRRTYEKNYGLKPADDICKVNVGDVPSFDILCAGFPCQPFSVAGGHKGFSDYRGTMFFETMKFVDHHHPKCVVFENVAGLESHDKGNSLKKIIETLEEKGYKVVHRILTCSDYGIPQMRKRMFIIGMKCEVSHCLLDFTPTATLSLTDYLNKGRDFLEHLQFTKKDVAYTIRCGGRGSGVNDSHNWDGYYAKQMCENEDEDEDEYVYRLSIQDCLKLQGFDENKFVLIGSDRAKWKMVGNTIPTNLTRLIGTAVKNGLLASVTDEKEEKKANVEKELKIIKKIKKC